MCSIRESPLTASVNLHNRVQLTASTIQRTLLLLIVVSLLCLSSCHSALAADHYGAGDSPTRPRFPTDQWVALANGEQHWYAFRDEGDNTAITVQMTVVPRHGATVTVFTPEQSSRWLSGEDVAAVGAGSEIPRFPNDLYWTGSFVQSGTYYVLVESGGQGLSNYKLTISGSRVSFPLLSFTPPISPLIGPTHPYAMDNRPPVAPTPVVTPTLTATPAPPPLSSPETPLPPIGKTLSIATGETHWYAFRDEGDDATIRVSADATPDDCLTFQVWTPEQLRLWQLGEEFRPVGQGTVNTFLKADRFWTGSFVKAGIYYIVVKPDPATTGACTYTLHVMGDDVSLVLPPTDR